MPTSRPAPRRASPEPKAAVRILGSDEASLLDVVDNALNKGVVLTGELTLALAQVDLVYARLSLLLCAADRVLPPQRAKTARWGPRVLPAARRAGGRGPRRLRRP